MVRILDLHGGELVRLDAPRGARVQVLFGTIWLTEPSRPDDVFARSGDEIALERGGRVLIEARCFARVIVPVSGRAPFLGHAGAWLRSLALHLSAVPLRRCAPTPH